MVSTHTNAERHVSGSHGVRMHKGLYFGRQNIKQPPWQGGHCYALFLTHPKYNYLFWVVGPSRLNTYQTGMPCTPVSSLHYLFLPKSLLTDNTGDLMLTMP